MLNFAPITFNPLFPSAQIDPAFKLWFSNGIIFLKDLFINNSFTSFDTLVWNYNIPQSHFFRYLQVHNTKHYSTFPLLLPDCPLEDCLKPVSNLKGCISRLHDIIQHINPSTLTKIKDDWEQDLELTIPDSIWDLSINRIYSICIRHCLLQFIVLHRLYFTKAKLSKIFSISDDSCPRCHQSPATMAHMFWSCNTLNSFWTSVFEVYSYICNKTIDPNPYMAIFGVPSIAYNITSC